MILTIDSSESPPERYVKHWLVDRDMSQRSFADLIGIDNSRLSKILTRKAGPTLDEASKIEEHTGLPASRWSRSPVLEAAG